MVYAKLGRHRNEDGRENHLTEFFEHDFPLEMLQGRFGTEMSKMEHDLASRGHAALSDLSIEGLRTMNEIVAFAERYFETDHHDRKAVCYGRNAPEEDRGEASDQARTLERLSWKISFGSGLSCTAEELQQNMDLRRWEVGEFSADTMHETIGAVQTMQHDLNTNRVNDLDPTSERVLRQALEGVLESCQEILDTNQPTREQMIDNAGTREWVHYLVRGKPDSMVDHQLKYGGSPVEATKQLMVRMTGTTVRGWRLRATTREAELEDHVDTLRDDMTRYNQGPGAVEKLNEAVERLNHSPHRAATDAEGRIIDGVAESITNFVNDFANDNQDTKKALEHKRNCAKAVLALTGITAGKGEHLLQDTIRREENDFRATLSVSNELTNHGNLRDTLRHIEEGWPGAPNGDGVADRPTLLNVATTFEELKDRLLDEEVDPIKRHVALEVIGIAERDNQLLLETPDGKAPTQAQIRNALVSRNCAATWL